CQVHDAPSKLGDGDRTAHEARLHEAPPHGARVVAVRNGGSINPNGTVVWKLGTLGAGETDPFGARVDPRVRPAGEGAPQPGGPCLAYEPFVIALAGSTRIEVVAFILHPLSSAGSPFTHCEN